MIDYNELLKKAKEVSDYSYSPYSKFPVGAALLTDENKVFTGTNVENSSYGLCLCAERIAVGQAVSSGFKNFKAIAIIGQKAKPCNPCGACLQVLSEFGPEMELILEDKEGQPIVKTLRDFLPNMFTPDSLQGN